MTLAVLLLAPVPLVLLSCGVSPALIHFWLSAQYLAVYPAFQASSPTLHLLALMDSQPQGCDESRLLASAARLDREAERIESLEKGGLLGPGGSLSTSGKAVARLFLSYRRCLGMDEGRG